MTNDKCTGEVQEMEGMTPGADGPTARAEYMDATVF